MPDSSIPRAPQTQPPAHDSLPGPAESDVAAPHAAESDVAAPDAAEPDVAAPDADEPGGDEPAGFENRAARRAKGRGTQQQVHGTAKHFGGRGSVQGPRQWGNRRTG